MKKSWQKLPAILCVMTLALTSLINSSIAEGEISASEIVVGEQPATETAVQTSETVEETQLVSETDAEPVVPAILETTEAEVIPESTDTPADTLTDTSVTESDAIDAVDSTASQVTEDPVSEEPNPAQEQVTDEEESASPSEQASVKEPVTTEESVQETNPDSESIQDEASLTDDLTDNESATETEMPAKTEAPDAETVELINPTDELASEETFAQAPINADLTLTTLKEGKGIATSGDAFVVRLISNVTGKVKVTINAASDLLVSFCEEGKEVSREILTNDEGDLTFNFNAEYDHSYLLLITSCGIDLQTGLTIASVPFHMISEKIEPAPQVEEATPAEQTKPAVEEVPAQEKVNADMKLKVGSENVAYVSAARPYIVRLTSNVTNKVNVNISSGAAIRVDFGKDDETASRTFSSDINNKLTFSFSAENKQEYLLYISVAEALGGTSIRISSAKAEQLADEESVEKKEEELTEAKAADAESEPEEPAEQPVEEYAEETDQIEETESEQETAEAETSADPSVNVRRVVITADENAKYHEGDTVHLNVAMDGFEGVEDYLIIWEIDKGEGWEEAARGQNNFYTFPASVETLSWVYRVRVLYR